MQKFFKPGKGNIKYRHGGYLDNRSEYNSWRAMVERCTKPRYRYYHRYGGRGITVCDRWLGKEGFINFLEDMGKKPTPKHSINRKDNDGAYEPRNCEWSSQTEQMSNTSASRTVTISGETKTVTEWARAYGVSLQTVYSRVKQLGWSWERAITTPTKGLGSNQTTY